MTGCELVKCPDYKEGKCHSTLNYVNNNTGEDMCPLNPDAIPVEDYENRMLISYISRMWSFLNEAFPEEMMSDSNSDHDIIDTAIRLLKYWKWEEYRMFYFQQSTK